ncbi:hypothetical protein HDF26_001221 [Pedobacter cryoconitis]|uniref:eCIS core domain-containing protein n=1 Tax=Pedobacter cryoconitis TaxID=188932 RepID=UPI001607BB4C|nr:DUF4157 domain-containing protein [Pedobacter cryoconitis]MBB6270794.1 hypothetical protein [Pedobacter cryoconitis]
MDNRISEKKTENVIRHIDRGKHFGMSLPAVPVLQTQNLEEKDLVQKKTAGDKEEEPVQFKSFQLSADSQSNQTGLPENLKTGIESLSGFSMNDVKVHYNSDKPIQMEAHAYAQGSDIHLAPGQEEHLAHEAWHVVQQKQGRVQPTLQLKTAIAVNDDPGLEREADVMGQQALQLQAQSAGISGSEASNMPLQKKMATSVSAIQRVVKATSFHDLLREQEELQRAVMTRPGDYAGKLVTVGFEHEFGMMIDEGLHGVSHLQIAESSNKMPYKNLPFYLETDAGNEIEMVDPPFLIETTKPGVPVPHPVDVDITMRIIEDRLYSLIQTFPTLENFVGAMQSNPGINFQVPAVQIKPMHLSQNTKGNFVEGANEVPSTDLLKMRLGPSDKYNGSNISTQINFATNPGTYLKMQDFNTMPAKNEFLSLGQDMANQVTKDLQVFSYEEGIFISQLNRVLAEQIAIPFMMGIQNMQEKEFLGGEKIRDSSLKSAFMQASLLSSKLKDIDRVWIKDSLMSIGAGLLGQEGFDALYSRLLEAKRVSGAIQMPDELSPDLFIYFEKAKTSIIAVLNEIINQIDNKETKPETIYKPGKKTEFLEHNPKLMGARQDTYIDPKNSQMPGIWDNTRLHVVETRSAGLEMLSQIYTNDASTKQVIPVQEDGYVNYNLLKHGYFKPGVGYYDPVLKVTRPLVNDPHSLKYMHYNPLVDMYYDPNKGLYYDENRKAYFDQALGMYYKPDTKIEASYYYNNDSSVIRLKYDSAENMYKDNQQEGIFYDHSKKSWFNKTTGEYRSVRLGQVTNPDKDIVFDPKTDNATDIFRIKSGGGSLIQDIGGRNRITNLPEGTRIKKIPFPTGITLRMYVYFKVIEGISRGQEGEILKSEIEKLL